MRKIFLLLRLVALAAWAIWPMLSGADTLAGDIPIDFHPVGAVAVDPSTNRIFVVQTPPFGPGLHMIDGATHKKEAIPLDSASAIAVDSVAGKTYVGGDHKLWIIDSVTLEKTFVALGESPTGIAVNPATNRIYLMHSAAGTVTVVDGATQATSTVTVGATPFAIAVNPTTNRIYVVNRFTPSLSVIDGADNTAVEIPLAPNPFAVAVDPVLNKIYVAFPTGNAVTVVDGATLTTTNVAMPSEPIALAVNPIDHKVYILEDDPSGHGKIVVMDGNTFALSPSIEAGVNARAIAIALTTHKTYVAGTDGGCRTCSPIGPITVLDGANNAVLQTFSGIGAAALAINPVTNRLYATYSTAGSGGFFSAGLRVIDGASEPTVNYPVGLVQPVAVNPVTNRIYGGNGSQILVFDGAADAPLTPIPVSSGAMFAVNPVTNRIYVANSGNGNSVTVIDGASQATTTVDTGRQPDVVAVNPLTNRIYTTSILDNTVTAIDGDTLATVTIPVGNRPERLGVDVARNLIYVANRLDGTVSIIDGVTNVATPLTVGATPGWVAVEPASGKVFVPLYGEDKVAVFAPPDYVVTKIPVGAAPIEVSINPVTRMAYVMNYNAHTVSVIDAATNAVVDTVTVPPDALSVLADPGTNRVYVGSASFGANINVLTVIDGITRKTHALTVNTGYHNLAVNPIMRKLYIGSQGATGLTVVSDPRQVMGPATTINALPGNKTASLSPSFTFTAGTGLNGDAARALFYQVDTFQGAWKKASGSGPFSGTVPQLTPGLHILYAYAVDAHSAQPNNPSAGTIAAYAFTVTAECFPSACADLSVTHASVPAQAFTGKDAVYTLTVSNPGPAVASEVAVTDTLGNAAFVWASPGCAHAGGVVTCAIGSIPGGVSAQRTVVVRPVAPGSTTSNATVSSSTFDPESANNQHAASFTVTTSPAGSPVFRYRLYSDATKEHHFTTDLNEYNVLGASGGWAQEGTVGKVLDNPGSFNGVGAVPYYRLYDSSTFWHHWTTDANEYYTLGLYPNWHNEGVDGYILPSNTAGATELYRLNYPFIPGLHHWTIDATEYNILISQYGWVGEPGAGFVVQ